MISKYEKGNVSVEWHNREKDGMPLTKTRREYRDGRVCLESYGNTTDMMKKEIHTLLILGWKKVS